MSNVGDMRHYLTLQQYDTVVQNAYGEETQGWADRTSHYAQITPLSGDELMTARQLNPEVTHRLDMWYSAAVLAPLSLDLHRLLKCDLRDVLCFVFCVLG